MSEYEKFKEENEVCMIDCLTGELGSSFIGKACKDKCYEVHNKKLENILADLKS